MTEYESIEKIVKELTKRDIRVIKEESARYLVAYRKQGTVKVGYMPTSYTHRYGIKTFCSITEGNNFPWFKCSGDDAKIAQKDLSDLIDGKLEDFPKLDVTTLTITS